MSITSNEDGDDEQALLNIIENCKKPEAKKEVKKEKKQKGPIEVNLESKDLSNFNTSSKKIIDQSDDKLNMKKLFVTEDDNEVYDQFEAEKQNEIENDLKGKIPAIEVKRGWNEWAGSGGGINEDRHKQKMERAEKIRKERI